MFYREIIFVIVLLLTKVPLKWKKQSIKECITSNALQRGTTLLPRSSGKWVMHLKFLVSLPVHKLCKTILYREVNQTGPWSCRKSNLTQNVTSKSAATETTSALAFIYFVVSHYVCIYYGVIQVDGKK